MEWLDLIVGAFLSAIIGIPLSYFFLIKSAEKKIEFEIESFNLITDKISENILCAPSLKIQYGTETDSEDVKILTSSIIKIENTGINAIVQKDISSDNPLRIYVKDDSKLYFVRELGKMGKANNFDIHSHEEKYVDISFTHLNRGDGIKIQVFHSGKSSEAIEICGTVIGGPEIKEKPKWKKNIEKFLIVGSFSFIISFIAVTLFFNFGFSWAIQQVLGTQVGLVSLVVLSVLLIVIIIVSLSMAIVNRIYDYIIANWFKKVGW